MDSNNLCQALLIKPGQANSAHLGTRPVARPQAGEVRLKTLEVGICGTDLEINEGLYGEAPAGQDTLVLGHEGLLEVVEVGQGVSHLQPGDLAVAIVRRPCPQSCPACAVGRWDLCITGDYTEHGIKQLDGFMREALVDDAAYVIKVPAELRPVAVLTEPLTIVEKAIEVALACRPAFLPAKRALVTGAGPVGLLGALLLRLRGYEVWVLDRVPQDSPKGKIAAAAGARYIDDSKSPLEQAVGDVRFDLAVEASGYAPLLFRAANLLARSGVLVLTGVTGGHHDIQVDANVLNSELVLENEVIVGSVNAAKSHYTQAVADLGGLNQTFPGLLQQLITDRVPLDQFQKALDRRPETIKAVLAISQG